MISHFLNLRFGATTLESVSEESLSELEEFVEHMSLANDEYRPESVSKPPAKPIESIQFGPRDPTPLTSFNWRDPLINITYANATELNLV